MNKIHPCFLLDSDKEASYNLVDKIIENKDNTNFSVYVGCTNDKGIGTFKLASYLNEKDFPKDRTYLFPGNVGQAYSYFFCNKTLVPEIVNGKNKEKYNKFSFLGKLLVKSLGQKTEKFKYIITQGGSSVSKKLGIERKLSDYDLFSYARKIASEDKKPDFVYFEAGSGVEEPITEWKEGINEAYKILKEKNINVNIGGGISDPKQLRGIKADKAVISTSAEKDPETITKFL